MLGVNLQNISIDEKLKVIINRSQFRPIRTKSVKDHQELKQFMIHYKKYPNNMKITVENLTKEVGNINHYSQWDTSVRKVNYRQMRYKSLGPENFFFSN